MLRMSVRHTHIVAAHGSRHNIAGGGQSVPPVRNRLVAAVKPHWRLYVHAATSRSALGGATPEAAAPPRRNRLRREDGGMYLTDPGGQLSTPPSSCRRHVAELPRIPPHSGDTRRPAAKVAARLAVWPQSGQTNIPPRSGVIFAAKGPPYGGRP